jgi:hypothetical protein
MGGKTVSITSFNTVQIRDQITRPADATAYAAGDVISEVTSNDHFTFGTTQGIDDRLGPPGTNSCTINAAILWSSANQSTKLDAELWLFTADIVNVADNSAFAPTDTEMLTLVAIVPFYSYNWRVGIATSGADGNAVCFSANFDTPVRCGAGGKLFGQLVARNAYTPVSGEIFTVDLVGSQDA